MPATTAQLSLLELFYRPRFGQILYCGKWQEQSKGIFHALRASFVEIPEGATDPQLACLYKAADMHYIVDGYLMIHQAALLNLVQLTGDLQSLWMPANWAREGACQGTACIKDSINLNQVASVMGPAKKDAQLELKLLSSCSLNKPGTMVTYSKMRVFYVPSIYNTQLRKASRNSVHGLSMLAWMLCVVKDTVPLSSAADLQQATQSTHYVQTFDFNNISALCPLLGYNP